MVYEDYSNYWDRFNIIDKDLDKRVEMLLSDVPSCLECIFSENNESCTLYKDGKQYLDCIIINANKLSSGLMVDTSKTKIVYE